MMVGWRAMLENGRLRSDTDVTLQLEIDSVSIDTVLNILFDTYALYIDPRSRQAVEQCFIAIFSKSTLDTQISAFLKIVDVETTKTSIASANAFVLIRWCSLFLQQFAQRKSLWDEWGIKIVQALVRATNTFKASNTRDSTQSTALRVMRRGFRKLFGSDFGDSAISECVKALTTKASTPTPQNAVILGVIAGVSSRLLNRTAALEATKAEYNAFYVREIIGSRAVLPDYIADGLKDYFVSYVSIEDLQKELIPAIEKALLRAPEVVLNNLLAPMVQSLAPSIDLSEILANNLLKPLLSSAKSSNATIKAGAARTFQTIADRCSNDNAVGTVVDEILTPVKQGRITAADQRAVFAQMLSALKGSSDLAKRIPQGLAPVALKEANEAAATYEIEAVIKHLNYGLQNGVQTETSIVDTLTKGVSEKRIPFRKIWALRIADCFWKLDQSQLNEPSAKAIIDAVAGKMVDTWTEVQTNPLQALQNGSLSSAYAATALCETKFSTVADLKCAPAISKASIAERALVADPKPSYLLNNRVYTKVTSPEDLAWFERALASVGSKAAGSKQSTSTKLSWAQAYIYLIANTTLTPQVQNDAKDTLQKLCSQDAEVSRAITEGLIQWCVDVELETKDSTASTARTGRNELYKVLRCVCGGSLDSNETNGITDQTVYDQRLLDLLVIARPSLLPRADWIGLCLKVGIDPGELAKRNQDACVERIHRITEDPTLEQIPAFQEAAFAAAADLAFVAPETLLPRLIEEVCSDLDAQRLQDIGPTEAAIYRTPEGTAFVDVLAKQKAPEPPSKNSKDYDTLKWESELRAQLAQKKGQAKKLTGEEQAKVNAQLKKESEIRREIGKTVSAFRRGIGIISGLVNGPPTETEAWFGRCIQRLVDIIIAGAGLILGDTPVLAYLQCATKTSSRLGTTRPFVGVATLRAAEVSTLPENYQEEPLGDLVTRVLYRLRFMGEQRPFDAVTLAYALPLIFLVLSKGGVAREGEEADEQIVLAGEFLSFHMEPFADSRLPRERLLSTLIGSLQAYSQHFRLFRDCLNDLCRNIAPSLSDNEAAIIVKATIVPEATVRTAALQAISQELDLESHDFYNEIWLACHDDLEENIELAHEVWEENELKTQAKHASGLVGYLESTDTQLRRATARSIADLVGQYSDSFPENLEQLQGIYNEKAKPVVPQKDKYGMPLKGNNEDPWQNRHGIALTFKELTSIFRSDTIVPFLDFMVKSGSLGDRNSVVRDAMLDAATAVVTQKGAVKVEELMTTFEQTLDSSTSASQSQDLINEAVVILYGALARHLPEGDARIPKVVQRLLQTLSTPSESVQYAVAQCLPPLVQASSKDAGSYVQQTMDEMLQAKKYAARRGAAYGLAGIIKGRGISGFREFRIMTTLQDAAENKKDPNHRSGAFLAYELFSLILGKVFEPYVIRIVPQLLAGFADTSADVREACLDAAKTCFAALSSYGVKQVLPVLLEGLDESQWRSKKGACDSLGAMAYLDPQQLAISLPEIIPPLTEVLNDSHKEVRASANRSLQRFGEVIENPEIKSQVQILLKALSDPTKFTDDALDALIKVNFIHYLDAPSLALVVRVLERGLGDRSATKRKASQIIGSLAHLTEKKDLTAHLPILVAGLREAIVDPVPATRATASKALGSTVEKLGEDALPDLIPSLMNTLKSDTGAGDRLGSAQALSEVLAGLGTGRLEETLPTILQNISSTKASVREGFMSLFIFLPATFGNSFSNYLGKIIPPILAGLADDVESIRDTSLRAGRLLVKNFATRSIDLLLPELERGLADDSYRIRLSSVELVGDLLFNLTGITGKADEDDEVEENANDAGQTLLEVLGEDKRNKVLSALYICRCDTSGLVRTAAMAVWKALVATPRTLRELIPTLTQLLIRRLASSNMEQKVIAGNALGELIRKAGENVLATLLPTLEEGLQNSTDTDARQGICIALRELISSASSDSLEAYEKTLISVIRTALVDHDADVREAAADAFDSLQRVLGKRAVDQVLPHLLNLLRSSDEAENALSALLTLLTEQTRSNIILPNLLPTLLTAPISTFNARALASLSEVASSAMTRRMPNILNGLMDSIITAKDEDTRKELEGSFDTVLLSVDEFDGLNTAMSVMLALSKNDDHRKRAAADHHLANFFKSAEIDISRYYPDLIRALLISFDDSDAMVVKAAWTALSALTGRLRKEEMEGLVSSTRTTLNQVGVAGHNLPGFSLPKGINAILPIFLQGLMNGSAEQRTQAALAISDMIDRTSADGLKPFVTQITGPLIRVVSERSVDVKSAILLTLNNLLEKIPTLLKPFLPQLQRTFAKSLADTSSELLRTRAAKALGTLITLTPRIDPLIAELVTGSKTPDVGVRNAMLKALYEVVSKAGSNMNDASKNSILGLIDSDTEAADASMAITNARLCGALLKVLPNETSSTLIKTRVLTTNFTYPSILALNSVLLSSPETLTSNFNDTVPSIIVAGITHSSPQIADNAVLASGKYLLTPSASQDYETLKPLFRTLASVISPTTSTSATDTRRLALVVLRTVARSNNALIRPHLPMLVPAVFGSVRDMVIPVKLAAEQAFLGLFNVVEEENAVFDKYMETGEGKDLAPGPKRSMTDYFKRVASRLGAQARERKEAEGGAGGLGLSSDEVEDEREVWSVGRVEIGEMWRDSAA